MATTRLAVTAVLLSSLTMALADGMEMDGHTPEVNLYADQYELPNYFRLEAYSGMMLAHIGFMVVAWVFVLPIGVVFSIARSRLAIPVQLFFLVLNGIGVVLGTVYNVSTPDLYVRNAHHSIGWIATWIMTAHVVMSLLFLYAGRLKKENEIASERAAFLPATLRTLRAGNDHSYHEYRWSGDSAQGTEPSTPLRQSRDVSPSQEDHGYESNKPEADYDQDDIEDDGMPSSSPRFGVLRSSFLDRFLAREIPKLASRRVWNVAELIYEFVDRTSLILGFIALTTGGVTYAGIFRSNNVFNGLAHFIKGGIFFWYGLLTLGRWMGCFADLGWAWNIKPTRSEVGQWKASLPTAEFVESFIIFLYGCSNVFLEHLAAWGGVWTAQDFEHVSISIMFFGGGLCGMLVESKTIRRWLNTSVDQMPTRTEVHPAEAQEIRAQPKSYKMSMNAFPALIILLLGIMMSSHHQSLPISTIVHKQWGTLLCGCSLARGLTYMIMWVAPPTSIYPSRPPTELVTAFCLMSGGLIFMASNKDMMFYVDRYKLMGMFLFTATVGFTAFLMAYSILVLSLKGWVIRRESKTTIRY